MSLEALTPREKEVALLVAECLDNQDIAGLLGCCTKTVQIHLHRCFKKLGITRQQYNVRRLVLAKSVWDASRGQRPCVAQLLLAQRA